jgi:hypothetical protein
MQRLHKYQARPVLILYRNSFKICKLKTNLDMYVGFAKTNKTNVVVNGSSCGFFLTNVPLKQISQKPNDKGQYFLSEKFHIVLERCARKRSFLSDWETIFKFYLKASWFNLAVRDPTRDGWIKEFIKRKWRSGLF